MLLLALTLSLNSSCWSLGTNMTSVCVCVCDMLTLEGVLI